MTRASSPMQRQPAPLRAQGGDDEVDAYLRVVTAGVDLAGVELGYALPVTVEPWVREFSEVMSRIILGHNRFWYVRRYLDR